MILDELAKQYNSVLNTGIHFEEIVMCPDLINLLEHEVSKLSSNIIPVVEGGFNETYFMDLKVVVSKFIPEDEVIFQNKTGEFARLKIKLPKSKVAESGEITGYSFPPVKSEVSEYRRITLGEEDGF